MCFFIMRCQSATDPQRSRQESSTIGSPRAAITAGHEIVQARKKQEQEHIGSLESPDGLFPYSDLRKPTGIQRAHTRPHANRRRWLPESSARSNPDVPFKNHQYFSLQNPFARRVGPRSTWATEISSPGPRQRRVSATFFRKLRFISRDTIWANEAGARDASRRSMPGATKAKRAASSERQVSHTPEKVRERVEGDALHVEVDVESERVALAPLSSRPSDAYLAQTSLPDLRPQFQTCENSSRRTSGASPSVLERQRSSDRSRLHDAARAPRFFSA